MKNAALIFPGQGVQKVGMGLEFYQQSPEAKAIFEQADQICANGLTKVMFEGPEEKLTSTAYCQPAILTMSIAALKAFEVHPKFKDISVKFTAGLSLGEYCALFASGVLTFEDTLRLVQKRAAFMEEATKENQGAMAAVIGFDVNKLREICRQTGAEIANYNSNEQVVITGYKTKVDAAIEAIKTAGGQKIIPLTVSGAFHSSLMSSAASKFAESLKDIAIDCHSQKNNCHSGERSYKPTLAVARRNPDQSTISVLSNVTALPHIDAQEIRANLSKQITDSVQWVKCVEYIAAQGITNFIEIGPGKVLKGLMRRIDPTFTVYNIEKPQDIEILP